MFWHHCGPVGAVSSCFRLLEVLVASACFGLTPRAFFSETNKLSADPSRHTVISVLPPFSLLNNPPPSCSFHSTLSQNATMLSSRALLRRGRVPPAAAASVCAGNNSFTASLPEASASRRRWRSTNTDASARNFSGLSSNNETCSSFSAWSNWGLPQLLVNVPKGKN